MASLLESLEVTSCKKVVNMIINKIVGILRTKGQRLFLCLKTFDFFFRDISKSRSYRIRIGWPPIFISFPLRRV